MKIYRYICASDTYHALRILPPFSWKDTYKVLGTPVIERWKPLLVEYARSTRAGNFPRLTGHVPVFDARALEVLRRLTAGCAEFLPLAGHSPDMSSLCALNVESIDCLDHERAEVLRQSDGRPLWVSRYAFHESAIGDRPIFRIKDLELSLCFVTEAFRDAIEKGGPEGLDFKEL